MQYFSAWGGSLEEEGLRGGFRPLGTKGMKKQERAGKELRESLLSLENSYSTMTPDPGSFGSRLKPGRRPLVSPCQPVISAREVREECKGGTPENRCSQQLGQGCPVPGEEASTVGPRSWG